MKTLLETWLQINELVDTSIPAMSYNQVSNYFQDLLNELYKINYNFYLKAIGALENQYKSHLKILDQKLDYHLLQDLRDNHIFYKIDQTMRDIHSNLNNRGLASLEDEIPRILVSKDLQFLKGDLKQKPIGNDILDLMDEDPEVTREAKIIVDEFVNKLTFGLKYLQKYYYDKID